MTPERVQLYLRCREVALGHDKQLMMVREPEYHGSMIAQSLMNAAAQQLAAHVVRGLTVPKKRGIVAPKGRRR